MGNEKKSIIRRIWNKIKFEWDMWRMDSLWRFYEGNRWALFPPSFYYRHTPEEAESIVERDVAYLQNVIDQYAAGENTTNEP